MFYTNWLSQGAGERNYISIFSGTMVQAVFRKKYYIITTTIVWYIYAIGVLGSYLFFLVFVFVPLYQMMFHIDFSFFRCFYYVFAMFSGTKTGTRMVLGEYIVDCTRGYG